MDATEWLDSVSASARMLRCEEEREEMMRNAALGLARSLAPSKGGRADGMGAVDAIIDAQSTRRERLEGAAREVRGALDVFDGMRAVGPLEADAANVLEAVHVGLMSKARAAEAAHVSLSTMKRRYAFGVEWLDAHGTARAREGVGAAT